MDVLEESGIFQIQFLQNYLKVQGFLIKITINLF